MTDHTLTQDERYMLEQLAEKPIDRVAPDAWEAIGLPLEKRGLVRRTSLNISTIRYEITPEGRGAIDA